MRKTRNRRKRLVRRRTLPTFPRRFRSPEVADSGKNREKGRRRPGESNEGSKVAIRDPGVKRTRTWQTWGRERGASYACPRKTRQLTRFMTELRDFAWDTRWCGWVRERRDFDLFRSHSRGFTGFSRFPAESKTTGSIPHPSGMASRRTPSAAPRFRASLAAAPAAHRNSGDR